MENKIISFADYQVPKDVHQEQIKIVLIDINGVNFEAIFNMPNTKEVLEMEAESSSYVEVEGKLFAKDNKVKKIEWILKNLLSAPAGLQIEHLNKLSALEIADTFR